jgi:hypothetical protein
MVISISTTVVVRPVAVRPATGGGDNLRTATL